MILLFPDLDTLRLSLTSSIVPTEVTLAPAAFSQDAQGRLYVEPTVSLTRTVTKNLDRLGVKGSKRHASDTPEELSCWPQILPLSRESGTPTISNQAPVLFELSNADDLPALVSEMLRLGNDRQGFRWFATPTEPDTQRVLLRVIGPPYYTLLRALDPSAAGTRGTVRAYLERSPRVWVEIGHLHPLAPQLRVAENRLLLIRAPRDWVYLEETPFQDVYDIIQFKLPTNPVGWNETKAPKRIAVPLRLVAGNAADVPELWVLRQNAIEQLDLLVRDSDERLTQRLLFAVATDPRGNQAVILRTRPSKLPAPVLPLENATGFKPYWKLPNLFVPVGKRVHPTLRREAVRKLLANDPDQVVWLAPDAEGKFVPESVPDSAFRSLEDWVDYVIEAEQSELAPWIEATRFDFDHFVCKDTGGPKTKPDKGDKEPRVKDEDARSRGTTQPKAVTKGKTSAARPGHAAELLPAPEVVKPPSEWKLRREELEKQFLALTGNLDDPDRIALWPQLARASAGIPDHGEAAVCWLNALWDVEPIPTTWLAEWLRSEFPTLSGNLKAEDLDRQLAMTAPGQVEARALVASFLWLANQNPVPGWLLTRLPAIQTYLERHESTLAVRAVWLAAHRLAQLAGADVLGLARVRDRLLQRLIEQGLQAERDLPNFLRFAGHKDSERMRVVREKAMELHATVQAWTKPFPVNKPYVDLLFAFALAKLGESSAAKKLVQDAEAIMAVPIPTIRNTHDDEKVKAAIVSNYLFKAYRYRVEQVLAGNPSTGPLSPQLVSELDDIHTRGGIGPPNNPLRMAHYAITRMRDQSRILEPHEKFDPYAEWTKGQDSVKKELTDLQAMRDPGKLADRIRKLYKEGVPGHPVKEVQFRVLHEGLPLSARVGEAFSAELLHLVPSTLAGVQAPSGQDPPELLRKQAELLDRALYIAGHYDRSDFVKKLVDEFTAWIHSRPEEARFRLINIVASQCLRSLKKFGMRDEIDRFLSRLRSEVLRGASIAELRKKHSAKPEQWGAVLQTLLNLAAGWLSFGLNEQAIHILDEARNELLNPQAVKLQSKDYTELARSYVNALGEGPSEPGLIRITELFKKMDEKRITNTWTTAQYYSRSHLNLVEDVIRAIVSDDFALGPTGRKWLDEDEYLVRRRIHADMRRERERSGF